MDNNKTKSMLTIEDVAAILNVSVPTVRNLIKIKDLKASKILGQWRIKENEVELLIERGAK